MSSPYPQVPLGEVVRHRKEFIEISDDESYKRCRVQLHAKGVVLRDLVGGPEIKTKRQQVCRADDFLVAEIDAKSGGYGIVPPELAGSVVSSHYFLFEVLTDRMDARFLNYCLRRPRFHDQVVAKGSTNYAAIRPADVLAYSIPLPPLNEQRRIVARINALRGKIEAARGLQREAAIARSALMGAAVSALVKERLRDRFPTKPLGDIADIRAGVTLGRRLTGATVSVPYLRVANVQDNHLDLSAIKKVEILPEEVEKWRLQPGDMLMTEGGDWDKLGRGAVWSGEIKYCIHQNHIFRVRIDQHQFSPAFLALLTGSSYGKTYFQTAAKRTTNLASINQKQLKAFQVFCAPLAEQQGIVAQVNSLQLNVDALLHFQTESAAELDALLPAVLERAFTGGL